MIHELQVGDIVLSKAGRDRGRRFIIKELTGDGFALICDGQLRPLARPKRKKLMHLAYQYQTEPFVGLLAGKSAQDAALRKHIAAQSEKKEE